MTEPPAANAAPATPAATKPPPLAARLEAAREFFTLRAAEKKAETIPAEKKAEMSRGLALARQRRAAAEVLWIAGETAEALRLAKDAFVLAFDAASPADLQDAELVALKKTVDDTKLPELDAELADPHTALFQRMIDAHDAIAHHVGPLALDRKGIASKRVGRIVLASVGAIAFVFLLWLVLHTPKTVRAEASGTIGEQFPASFAVDGRKETEWFLPDGATGWIDFTLGPPRKVTTLKLINALAPPYDDRGTKDYHVDVFVKGQAVKGIDGTLNFTTDPQWVAIPIGVDGVERIRFEIRSSYKKGGGLAEVEID